MFKSIVISVLAALALVGPVGSASAATPADARGFVDTIGVNTHLFFDDTAYGDFSMVKQRLQELGVRHVRDGMDPGRRQWFYNRVNSLAQTGIKSTLITCSITAGVPAWVNLDNWVYDAKTYLRGSLDALEGANEPNYVGGAWIDNTRGCQYWLKRLSDGENYGAPLGIPTYGPSPTGTTFQQLGDLAGWADAGNYHPYPGGRNPSGPDYYPFARAFAEIRDWNFDGRQVPVVATETGYHDALSDPTTHPPTSQRAAAIYLPRLFLEYHRAGVARTFTYELVDQFPDPERDEREKNFGLFENDWSYKPSASALKNTIGFLDSPSVSSRTPLDYTLSNTGDPDGSGTGGAVKDSLFQKADGSWWLALWQDSKVWDAESRKDISNSAVRVSVTLPRTMNVTAYLPTRGTETYGSGRWSSFSAGVGDDVLLIKLAD